MMARAVSPSQMACIALAIMLGLLAVQVASSELSKSLDSSLDEIPHARKLARACKAPSYTQPPRGKPAPPVELKNDQFVRKDNGKPVNMHGYNWFGFNNRMTFVNGLWVGAASMNSDFAAIIWQMKLLGFNAIRLPFLFGDLKSPAQPVAGWCVKESSLADMAKRTTDPLYTSPIKKPSPKPPVPLPKVSEPGSCNKYVPGGRTMDRFLWTVQWLVANGMYVLIDYHPMAMENTAFNARDFVESWAWVWDEVSCLPNFNKDMVGRVFVDIMNEPDSQGQAWQPQQGKAGMTELYLGVMDKLWSMTPGAPIFFINGGGQGAYMALNWGNGYITDRKILKEYSQGLAKITDANPFFQALLKKPYAKRVVISPHIYGPSVSNAPYYKGKDWMVSLDNAFGYLTTKGYCHQGKCQRFPVAVGEFGSRFQKPEDLAHLRDLALYLNAEGPGNTGGHKPIKNWFYWSYNANSGDTGGLVDDQWMNLEWVKLRYLMNSLGLKPWYKGGVVSEMAPRPVHKPVHKPAHKPVHKPAAKPEKAPHKPVHKPAKPEKAPAGPHAKPHVHAKPKVAKPHVAPRRNQVPEGPHVPVVRPNVAIKKAIEKAPNAKAKTQVAKKQAPKKKTVHRKKAEKAAAQKKHVVSKKVTKRKVVVNRKSKVTKKQG